MLNLEEDLQYETVSTVTCMKVNQQNDIYYSTWDKTINKITITGNSNQEIASFDKPILSFSLSENSDYAYLGGLNQELTEFNFEKQYSKIIGAHENAINKVIFDEITKTVISSGFDDYIKLFDIRQNSCLSQIHQKDFISDLKFYNGKIFVLIGTNEMIIIDQRKLNTPEFSFKSPENIHISTIEPIDNGFIYGSYEGRIFIEYFNSKEKNYSFKAHLKENSEEINFYPVTSLSKHWKHSFFTSGGGDSQLNFWDIKKRKKIFKAKNLDNSILHSGFNSKGDLFYFSTGNLILDFNSKHNSKIYSMNL